MRVPCCVVVALMLTAAPVALYVHVPFCVSVCPYCDFVVYAGSAARGPRNRMGAFLEALENELDLRADAVVDHANPASTGNARRPAATPHGALKVAKSASICRRRPTAGPDAAGGSVLSACSSARTASSFRPSRYCAQPRVWR